MEKDENRTNLIIIIVLMSVLVGVTVFTIVHHFLTKDSIKKNESESNEIINSDTDIETSEEDYYSYSMGDSVTLSDSSKWHVIQTSLGSNSYVTILKDTVIDANVSYQKAEEYLNKTYLQTLITSLNTKSNNISDIRLLTLSDISTITGITNLESGTSIENSDLDWLYNSQTLTSDISENNRPFLICPKDSGNQARICEGTDTDIKSIKPVITIHKNCIKK